MGAFLSSRKEARLEQARLVAEALAVEERKRKEEANRARIADIEKNATPYERAYRLCGYTNLSLFELRSIILANGPNYDPSSS
jgi:hypothetical protein